MTVLLSGGPPADIGISPGWAIALAIFCVFLNGFFVAAEFALVKVRPTQIEPHLVQGGLRARLANRMIRHLDAYLSATQLGITLASLALGWLGEPAFASLLTPLLQRLGFGPALIHTISLALAFSVITVLHIIVGELAPKSLAIRKPEATTLWVSVPLYYFYKVTYPLIWLLNGSANFLLKRVGIEPISDGDSAHSEEELRRLLASESDNDLSEHKRELLENVFELSERTARQTMVPRADIVFLDSNKTVEENLQVARQSGHTRYPYCDDDLDHVLGIVHIKDVFQAGSAPESLDDLRRPVAFIPETLPADRLLRRMRAEKVHMAAVLDEFGGVSGIVTMENVLEEIVGEIQDEFDSETPDIVRLSPTRFKVAGSMLVAELEESLEMEISDRDEDTIAGIVLSEIGRRALVGDKIHFQNLNIEVQEVHENRIMALLVEIDVEESE
jgi:CBS domain containing-hemolysin-like protein